MKSRLAILLMLVVLPGNFAQETNAYLEFVRAQAAALHREDQTPKTAKEWRETKLALRTDLMRAWGEFPEKAAPLEARKLGELQRDGYRVEKIIFQTLPGVWMTANAYVPDRPGKMPALLMVHGHWRGAKQDPVVQARCIGAVKLGFFVLAVDAFGAGERGVGRALGEYHGDMTAATLLPAGLPLSGLQVYENIRAVDYLQHRPEVDASRIGVTGASGGGNQSMYAGAWDERLSAASPVCSVGNYQAYLGAACCMCEVVPGALCFTEEWGILGMVAPRALMVINATRDSRQFSVEQAKISLSQASAVFQALSKSENLRHVTFESGHGYSRPMREAVYGWMSLHLKHEGDGSPIPEPAITPEDPEILRCFPGESRPKDWVTLPKFAAKKGRELLKSKKAAGSAKEWLTRKGELEKKLVSVLGRLPKSEPLQSTTKSSEGIREITFSPEPGIYLIAKKRSGNNLGRIAIVIDLEGEEKARDSNAAKELSDSGWNVVTLDLRATGKLGWPQDKVGRAPDHTTAEWGLWIGRPLLGQWVYDLRRLVDVLTQADGNKIKEIEVVGAGPAGVVALTAAALDDRITSVRTIGSLVSFVSETPYENQRLGIIVPGILRDLGDIQDIAALIAPRPLTIEKGVAGDGQELRLIDSKEHNSRTRSVYSLLNKEQNFQVRD